MKLLSEIVLSIIGRWGLVKNMLLALLSGISSFLFISIVNVLMSKIIGGQIQTVPGGYILYLLAVIIVFVVAKRILGASVVKLSQILFWKKRKEIMQLVLGSGYKQIQQKRYEIYTALNNDVNALTQASNSIIDFLTNIIISLACFAYLASISLRLFAVTVITAVAGVYLYSRDQKKVSRKYAEAIELENNYMQKANSILDGFKEIFMEPRKGIDIFENRLTPISDKSYAVNYSAQTSMLNGQAMVQLLFYILISSVLLFAGHITKVAPNELVKYIFTLIFLVGAVSTVIILLPGLAKATASYNHLIELGNELQSSQLAVRVPEKYLIKGDFKSIGIEQLEFSYDGSDERFSIGPLNFSIDAGDLVFIYGGNGSGKTTFIYTLLGIYLPKSGKIKLNGYVVTEEKVAHYRSTFSMVCSDFYLFEELYGIDSVDKENWEEYIELFELGGIVELKDKKFSTLKLSTGQRKRLAIIAALLEDKPVLVIDEWAADQDPLFRRKFYTVILPLLKSKGITVIAITHDDKYYHVADRIYHMDEGALLEENSYLFHETLPHK